MKDKLFEIAALLEQMSISGERNATIYVTCLREIRAVAEKLPKDGGKADGNANPESKSN